VEYFNRATKDVPLLYVLYFMCIPLAKALRFIGATPTQVTHLSNVFALAAVGSLVWISDPWWFPALWVAALCFDVADGMVARANASSSASGSFYDHVSDQVKIVGLFLAVGLRYDDSAIWVLTYLLNAAFLLSAVINQVIAHRRFRLSVKLSDEIVPPEKDNGASYVKLESVADRLRALLRRWPRTKRLVRGVYLSIFSVYGNSMLLLVPLSFGKNAALLTMLFFSLVMARSLWILFRAVYQVNQQLSRNAVPWKS
jgi:phosphatidylglycerophosphate synthase